MSFFAPIDVMEPFDLFGIPHLSALALMSLVCVLIVVFRRQIIAHKSLEKGLRFTLVSLLVFQQITYYLWNAYVGKFDLATVLPLNLCAISIFMLIYSLATLDRRLFAPIYFLGTCGTLQALLTPSIDGYNFPHFRFFQFFTGHTLIIISVVYMLAVLSIHVNLYEFIKTFVVLQITGVAALIGNELTGGNYMFLSHKPDSASIMDLLAPWPYYLFQLEGVALFFMVLFAIPYVMRQKKDFFRLSLHQPLSHQKVKILR